jgi:hypothetical protein
MLVHCPVAQMWLSRPFASLSFAMAISGTAAILSVASRN